MEANATPFVTIVAASHILDASPREVEELVAAGHLRSYEDDGIIYVSRPDVLAAAVTA